MNTPPTLENLLKNAFDEADVMTVVAIWRDVEAGAPLSPDIAQLASLFDEKHPGMPIYNIIKELHAKKQ